MTKSKKALITGITGQDGSYLAELLLGKGYEVVGLMRRSSHHSTERIDHLLDYIRLVEGDVTDYGNLYGVISKYAPNEIYNLAAMSHVKTSFDQPLYTFDVGAKGVLNILEIMRNYQHTFPPIKFYQASSSEMFGDQFTIMDGKKYQDENTKMNPQSPYAVAKLAAYNITKLYRKSYNLFACNGILFNHESPRRGNKFVTKKVIKWIGDFLAWRYKIMDPYSLIFEDENIRDNNKNVFPKLRLGNLSSVRDWGHAKDYVRAMYLMLQEKQPDDYVIATGETHSVENFVQAAFSAANLGMYKHYTMIDKELFRPSEVPYLCGKATKARAKLWWEPQISFQQLVEDMLNEELKNRYKC